MKPFNIIFMGTPAFAVPSLQALHAAGHRIAAVYTQPPRPAGRGQKEMPSPVQAFAESVRLPVHTPPTLKDADVQRTFTAHGADVGVVAAYGLLLPKAILQAPRMGCINVHPSLLPRWRGAAPIQRTLMAGDRETGVGIMQMDEGLDTGDVLMQQRFPIPDTMNAGMLHDALAAQGAELLLKTLEALGEGSITAVKQSAAGITYANKISKEECRIDWQKSAAEISHHIRGLSPSPGAFFTYNNEPIKILDAHSVAAPTPGSPGRVVDNNLSVACGSGMLMSLLIQRAGKKAMPVQECLRGFAIPLGSILS